MIGMNTNSDSSSDIKSRIHQVNTEEKRFKSSIFAANLFLPNILTNHFLAPDIEVLIRAIFLVLKNTALVLT